MLLKSKNCSNCGRYYDPTLEQCPTCHKRDELYEQRGIPSSIVFFHPAAQIGLFVCGFAYIGMLISEIIAAFFLNFVPKGDYRDLLILVVAYLLMLLGLLLIALLTRRNSFLKKFERPFDYLFGLAFAVMVIVASSVVGSITQLFYQAQDNANQSAAVTMSLNYPILSGIILCLIGPICEEMTYRVGLYSFFRRINIVLAMIVTTIIFAFIHFDFTAEDMINELWNLPSYIVAGLVLTIAYEVRGPACSMMAHILYNTFAFIMILLRI